MAKGTGVVSSGGVPPAAIFPGTDGGRRNGLVFRLGRELFCPPGLPYNFIAFLLARVSILGELAPFGLAFCAALAQSERKRAPAATAAMLAGVVSTGRFLEAGLYLCVVLFFVRFAAVLTRQQRRLQAVPLFVFAAVLLGGAGLVFWQQAPLYMLFVVIFDAALCVVLMYIFQAAAPLLAQDRCAAAAPERVMCFVVLVAAAVAGFGEAAVAGFGLRNMAGSLAIMALALAGGPGLGASAGVAVGLVAGLSDGTASLMVALYGIAGMLAAAFRPLGKLAVIVGFLLGSAIAALQFAPGVQVTRVLAEAAMGAAVFAVIPFERLRGWVRVAGEQAAEPGRRSIGEAVAKLAGLADIFGGMANALGRRADEDGAKAREEEEVRLLAAVGERVCGQCRRRTDCWDRERESTLQAMVEALAAARNRRLVSDALPAVLREGCVSGRELAEAVNHAAEQNRAAARWAGRTAELRRVAAEQLRAVGTIVRDLAGEVGKEPEGAAIAGVLRDKAALAGCPLAAVTLAESGDRRRVRVSKRPCQGERECLNVILPLAAAAMSEPLTMEAACGDAGRGDLCRLVLEAAGRFGVTTGWAAAGKERVCGDTAAVLSLSGGRVALVLSDGMGSGRRAAEGSGATVRFLERLLAAGFAVDAAVKTVNSLLLLELPAESFATVDMAVIDTCAGVAEFLKVGAAPSFVKRVREVATVRSASLPAGIVQQVEIEPVKWLLAPGDTVVMVSDGVVEAPGRLQEREPWLVNYLRRLPDEAPQAMAERILRQAADMNGPRLRDDMTVLVARVTGKAGLG